MRRDLMSNRSVKWIMRNTLDKKSNESYVRKLLEEYEIDDFEIQSYKDDELALFIYIDDLTYILYIDTDWVEIKVLCSKDNYKRYVAFTGDVAWRKSIEGVVMGL